jgi:diguanylate cyclase (GGDEF)-like protein
VASLNNSPDHSLSARVAPTVAPAIAHVPREDLFPSPPEIVARGPDEGSAQGADAARHYRRVYHGAPVALVSADTGGRVLRWNDRADLWFSDRLRRGRANTLAMLLGDAEAGAMLADLAFGGYHRSELRWRSAGLEERVCAVEATLAGPSVELCLVDVTERSRLADAFQRMAYCDPLTGLLNRRGLEREDEVLQVRPQAPSNGLVFVDLDRFKAINDVFGHAVGDAVIVEVAERLRGALPPGGLLSRVGGDEFVALLPGVDLDGTRAVADRMLAALEGTPCAADGPCVTVAASFGVAEVRPPLGLREAMMLADDACARAKRTGRGRVTTVGTDDRAREALRESLRLGEMLRTRLPVDRLRLYAQPIVPLTGAGTNCGFEVLLRTVGECGRIEAPGALLEIVERHGGMPMLDRFVLERTLRHLADHPAHASAAAFFAVNLGGPSLNDGRFVRDAVAMLREHPALAPKICLEITEAVAVQDLRGARRFIDTLRQAGAMIALDDFGAGYTSFAYLMHLPAAMLKIDGQFIGGLASDVRQRSVVQAIVRLAHELGMQCIAEWVEDPDTLQTLLALDVDHAQGWLFERPAPIESWMERPAPLDPLHAVRAAAARAAALR